jgi:outer membrane protein
MKNISLALNAILVIAVAVLYYLYFKKPVATESSATVSKDSVLPFPKSDVSIVHVNTDTLLHNLDFYKTKKAEFEAKQERIKKDLEAESNKLQNDAEAYQQRGGIMTESERAKAEEELMRRQENLMKKKDEMIEKLDNEQSKFSEELHTKLNSYLKDYNKDKNYTYILGYSKGGGILLANDSLDVTNQILEGLNKPGEKK